MVAGTPNANPRLIELGLYATPTTYFDAGDETLIGGYTNPVTYGTRVESVGAREVPDIDLSVTLTYNTEGTITADVSATLNTYINLGPSKPSTPGGVSEGFLETPYTFTTSTTDPENDQVWYMWSWGDGTFSDWLGPYESGEEASAENSWDVPDDYQVRVKAKDENDQESQWSNAKYAHIEGYPYMCGDANADQSVDISDAVSIINFVFIGGDPPDPIESGDANCDGSVDISDAVYIINFVFIGGNDPCDPDGDGEPNC